MDVLPGKILIVDHDLVTARQVSNHLKNKGYFITSAKDGADAVRKAQLFTPDLVLIDTMAAGRDEIQTIQQASPAAIILLTGPKMEPGTARDEFSLFYIPKPVKPETLAYKIETALRPFRKEDKDDLKHVHEDLEINLGNFTVYYKGKKIAFAKKEFELLALLISRPGRVFLREDIMLRIWGSEANIGMRTIDVHVRKIRQKLGSDVIKTVKRVGYKLQV